MACILVCVLASHTSNGKDFYRPNWLTNKHNFTSKLVTEWTIRAREESECLIILDISKAFKCINRNWLEICEEPSSSKATCHLHATKCLTLFKLWKCIGQKFWNQHWSTQGDWASSLEFICYHAKTRNWVKFNKPSDNFYVEQIKDQILLTI